jgi:hypothetical protein
LSFIHVLELAAQEADSRDRVAQFVDEVREATDVQWVKAPRALAHLEVRAAFLAHIGTSSQPFVPFVPTLVDALEMEPDWIEKAVARTHSIKRSVAELAEVMARRQDYRRFRASVPARKEAVRRSRGKYRRLLITEKQKILNDLLPNQLVTDGGLTVSVSPEDRECFLSKMDLTSCPVVALRVAIGEGWTMGSSDAPSDFEDWGHLGGVAYSDVAFVDGRTWEALKKGKTSPLPRRNGEFSAWATRAAREQL